MIVINEISQDKFEIDGVPYWKNFLPHVVGNRIRIVNNYDSCFVLMAFKDFEDVEVNGEVYNTSEALQLALLPVLFTRNTLGGEGSAVWSTITGNIYEATSLINLINTYLGASIENHYENINDLFAGLNDQTEGKIQFVLDDTPYSDGYAYYEYLGTTLSTILDYRKLSTSEVSIIESGSQWATKTIKDIQSSFATYDSIIDGRCWLSHNNTNYVDAIYFDAPYSQLMKGIEQKYNDGAQFAFHIYNSTQNRFILAKIKPKDGLVYDGSSRLKVLLSNDVLLSQFELSDSLQIPMPKYIGEYDENETIENEYILEYNIAGDIDGINKVFTTTESFEQSTLKVWLNGVLQHIPNIVTKSGDNEITFKENYTPQLGDEIITEYFPTIPREVHAFILGGQSNMVGFDSFDNGEKYPIGTLQFNQSNIFINAESTLDHVDEPAGSMGLSLQFIIDYLVDKPNVDVVLIPCADGNTGFSNNWWNVGNTAYELMVSRVNQAFLDKPYMQLKGFLWHQGEVDSTQPARDNLLNAFTNMYDDAITRITPLTLDTPLLVGGIKDGNSDQVATNLVIESFTNVYAKSAYISSVGLVTFDGTHFNSASLRIFGARYLAGLNLVNSQ